MVASLTANGCVGNRALRSYALHMANVTARKRPKDATPTPFGLRLKASREAKGLSMRELAQSASTFDAKVSHATVSLIESGRQATVDANTAVRLARAVGCTVEWLVDGA